MPAYLSADIIFSETRTIFRHKEATPFIVPQKFLRRVEKCFRTVFCSLRRMSAFQCSLIQIYEQTNMFLLLQPKKRLSFKVLF